MSLITPSPHRMHRARKSVSSRDPCGRMSLGLWFFSMTGVLAITVYWPIVVLSTVFFAKNAPRFHFVNYTFTYILLWLGEIDVVNYTFTAPDASCEKICLIQRSLWTDEFGTLIFLNDRCFGNNRLLANCCVVNCIFCQECSKISFCQLYFHLYPSLVFGDFGIYNINRKLLTEE